MYELGQLVFSDKYAGIITYPVGSIPSVQVISDIIEIKPLNQIKEGATFYKIKREVVSETYKLDAVRYLYTEFIGKRYKQSISRPSFFSFKRAHSIDSPNGKMLYVYLERLSERFEDLLKHLDEKRVSVKDILAVVVANPTVFEKL